nr:protein unc-50 homolog [Tanacetum cinerariifolium]
CMHLMCCNSFFSLFIVIYVTHFLVSPILVAHGYFPLATVNHLEDDCDEDDRHMHL